MYQQKIISILLVQGVYLVRDALIAIIYDHEGFFNNRMYSYKTRPQHTFHIPTLSTHISLQERGRNNPPVCQGHYDHMAVGLWCLKEIIRYVILTQLSNYSIRVWSIYGIKLIFHLSTFFLMFWGFYIIFFESLSHLHHKLLYYKIHTWKHNQLLHIKNMNSVWLL